MGWKLEVLSGWAALATQLAEVSEVNPATVKAMNDAGTAVVATTAIASPLWLDAVQSISSYAELLLPILGAAWLAVQIVYKIKEYKRAERKREEAALSKDRGNSTTPHTR